MVEDFLPPPDQLVLRDDGLRVTISLSNDGARKKKGRQ
jgi:hypothetical protein